MFVSRAMEVEALFVFLTFHKNLRIWHNQQAPLFKWIWHKFLNGRNSGGICQTHAVVTLLIPQDYHSIHYEMMHILYMHVIATVCMQNYGVGVWIFATHGWFCLCNSLYWHLPLIRIASGYNFLQISRGQIMGTSVAPLLSQEPKSRNLKINQLNVIIRQPGFLHQLLDTIVMHLWWARSYTLKTGGLHFKDHTKLFTHLPTLQICTQTYMWNSLMHVCNGWLISFAIICPWGWQFFLVSFRWIICLCCQKLFFIRSSLVWWADNWTAMTAGQAWWHWRVDSPRMLVRKLQTLLPCGAAPNCLV